MKILVNGVKKEGEPIGVVSSSEPWAEHLLMDGTLVRTRLVLIAAYKVLGETAPNGQQLYQVETHTIMAIVPGTQ